MQCDAIKFNLKCIILKYLYRLFLVQTERFQEKQKKSGRSELKIAEKKKKFQNFTPDYSHHLTFLMTEIEVPDKYHKFRTN